MYWTISSQAPKSFRYGEGSQTISQESRVQKESETVGISFVFDFTNCFSIFAYRKVYI